MRPRPDAGVLAWLNAQLADTLYLSGITLAELLFGIGALPQGSRRDRLQRALDGLIGLFPGRILPFDQDAAARYAQVAVAARWAGRPLPVADGYIAAIALSRGFAVATRNIADFQATGVSLIDPWRG